MTDWDGKERRRVDTEVRDLVIRIDANLTNHINTVSKHVEDDNIRFQKIDKDITIQSRIIYGALGIASFLALISRFLH